MHFIELLHATQEGRTGDGQIRPVKALERREVAVAELEDVLRRRQVLEPMLAQIAQPIRARKRSGRGRDEHLPAVATGSNPRSPVHVDPDVALGVEVRRSRVDAHTHADRAGGESVQCLAGGRQRARGGRESDEESIALRVDLDAPIGRERLTQDAAMLGKRPGVVLGTEFVQQLRRALDVREEKRHRPGRELWLHPPILSRPGL